MNYGEVGERKRRRSAFSHPFTAASFAAIGGVLFGMDLANWAGASNKGAWWNLNMVPYHTNIAQRTF
jgi:hypothetical protein